MVNSSYTNLCKSLSTISGYLRLYSMSMELKSCPFFQIKGLLLCMHSYLPAWKGCMARFLSRRFSHSCLFLFHFTAYRAYSAWGWSSALLKCRERGSAFGPQSANWAERKALQSIFGCKVWNGKALGAHMGIIQLNSRSRFHQKALLRECESNLNVWTFWTQFEGCSLPFISRVFKQFPSSTKLSLLLAGPSGPCLHLQPPPKHCQSVAKVLPKVLANDSCLLS